MHIESGDCVILTHPSAKANGIPNSTTTALKQFLILRSYIVSKGVDYTVPVCPTVQFNVNSSR